MRPWPEHPVIYEINTWTWMHDLSQKHRRVVTLETVPVEEWDTLASWGFDAVWLMGVWERSPAGIRVARAHQGLQADFRRALPDFTPDDVVGSPYCVRRYTVDAHLGGPEGLVAARWALANRGMRLVLDFVPNHVAPDHPWILAHPEYFIRGSAEDLRRAPSEFFEAGGKIFACGRDPYFPPWTDVAQLNGFHPGLRQAMVETLDAIGKQCDGVRCDMAMLLMTQVFERTWGTRAGARPAKEYWREVIGAVRAEHPDILFLAEAYWDLEWELQQQGFDYCYDKRLYDRLEHDTAEAVRLHLSGDRAYQYRLVRFIENHDEPRAAASFSAQKSRAAAVTISALPGAKLLHEGQFDGKRVRLPVQLGRGPEEPEDPELKAFYRTLLRAVRAPAFRAGEWLLCERTGWPDNPSYLNLVAWCWRKAEEKHLIIVNLSETRSQARIPLPWDHLTGRSWRLTDALSGAVFDRDGDELRDPGLYVELEAWGYHFLTFGVNP
jgi:glycosidase